MLLLHSQCVLFIVQFSLYDTFSSILFNAPLQCVSCARFRDINIQWSAFSIDSLYSSSTFVIVRGLLLSWCFRRLYSQFVVFRSSAYHLWPVCKYIFYGIISISVERHSVQSRIYRTCACKLLLSLNSAFLLRFLCTRIGVRHVIVQSSVTSNARQSGRIFCYFYLQKLHVFVFMCIKHHRWLVNRVKPAMCFLLTSGYVSRFRVLTSRMHHFRLPFFMQDTFFGFTHSIL